MTRIEVLHVNFVHYYLGIIHPDSFDIARYLINEFKRLIPEIPLQSRQLDKSGIGSTYAIPDHMIIREWPTLEKVAWLAEQCKSKWDRS